jgi:crossover junction endodeoxyribonuclease RuvC
MQNGTSSPRIRILGIDPGSQVTGYGVVDAIDRQTVLVHYGVVRTSGDHSDRLRTIFAAIRRIVTEYEPAEIAVERVFVHRNADSALKLGQARAAALCASFDQGLPIYEYAARHIKKAVVGSGAAEKAQVQKMIQLILGVREAIEADAADALAAALCHAHERNTNVLLRQAMGAL